MSEEAARRWCESSESGYTLDISTFAKKVREYIEWKSNIVGKNHFVIFLCDEMGQYMGTDGNILLNLQTVVESLGTECGGRAWVIATGQEDISSIVNETKTSRDDFSKIIGRFDTRISLSSANVDEVIKERLLAKTENGAGKLRLVFGENSAILKNLIQFSHGTPEKKLSPARMVSWTCILSFRTSSNCCKRSLRASASMAHRASICLRANVPCSTPFRACHAE
jgi:hypothetical protein